MKVKILKILKNKISKKNSFLKEFEKTKKYKKAKVPSYYLFTKIKWEKVISYYYLIYYYKEIPLTKKEIKGIGFYSDSGSIYWYTEKYLYRLSNHWGKVASCEWSLKKIKKIKKLKIIMTRTS